MSRDLADKTTEELEEIRTWFSNQGWEDNAEKVAEELSRRGELESSEELAGSIDDELTHVAQLDYAGP